MGWFSEFYKLLYVSDIGVNSIAQFQFGASNSETNTLKKEKTLFETNMKLCNIKFEKIKI